MLAPVTDLGKALLYYIIAFGLCLGLTAWSPSIGTVTRRQKNYVYVIISFC